MSLLLALEVHPPAIADKPTLKQRLHGRSQFEIGKRSWLWTILPDGRPKRGSATFRVLSLLRLSVKALFTKTPSALLVQQRSTAAWSLFGKLCANSRSSNSRSLR
jgi:hypothetical protein